MCPPEFERHHGRCAEELYIDVLAAVHGRGKAVLFVAFSEALHDLAFAGAGPVRGRVNQVVRPESLTCRTSRGNDLGTTIEACLQYRYRGLQLLRRLCQSHRVY